MRQADALGTKPQSSAVWWRAIEDRDAALAAAEFPNQINQIVRAGRDIARPRSTAR